MSGPRAPKDIRCVWTPRKGERGTYDCLDCGCWTANLPLYRFDVCPAKDRRKGLGDRREDARNPHYRQPHQRRDGQS